MTKNIILNDILFYLVFLIVGAAITILYTAPQAPEIKQSSTNMNTHPMRTSAFSLGNAPVNSLVGSIATQSGTVEWQSRIATQPGKFVPKSIQQGEEIQTGTDGHIKIQVASLGLITLLPNTHVGFIQMLPVNSLVSQVDGIGEYVKNGGSPFDVRTFGLLTQIEGDAVITVDAHNSNVAIQVKEGLVTEAFNDADDVSQVIQVKAGEEFLFDDNTSTSRIIQLNTR